MKRRLEVLLSLWPPVYRVALRFARSGNIEKSTFLRLIRSGQTVLDIGANQGDFTILFSNIVRSRGQVHAFEPVPPTFERLSERVTRSAHYLNVRLNPFGLANNPGTFPIHVPASDFGQASLRRQEGGSWAKGMLQTIECEFRTLDRYVAEAGLEKIDFVKLDVEGAELLVLQGGASAFRKFRPILHFEYSPQWSRSFGYDSRDLVTLLKDFGYRHFYSGSLEGLPQRFETLPESAESQNFVAGAEPLTL